MPGTPARHLPGKIIETIAIFTIVSNNYLHFARTLLQSARARHPDSKLYCVIVDRDPSHAIALVAEFEAIPLEALRLPLGEEFAFQYSIVELNTAVKPWAFEYLLDRGHRNVVYLDPDTCLYAPMLEVVRELSGRSDIVLTPHLLAPITDDKTPSELDILRTGAYNLGFCAVRESENTRNFLRWWQGRLTRGCAIDLQRGLFVDQGWIDLAPGLFDNVGILRHAGYNVAYWNIAQRPLTEDAAGKYFAREDPLVLFHFSGLDPSNPEPFSRYQDRFRLSTLGAARALVDAYCERLGENAAAAYARLPYGFAAFDSGEKVPDEFRRLYRESREVRDAMGARPFERPQAMCETWRAISIDGISPTHAMMASWNARRELQVAFSLASAESIRQYYRYFTVDPALGESFPKAVMSHHENVIRGWTPAGDWLRSTQRVRHLYSSILERSPDPEGLRHYGEWCRARFGFLRAWKHIAFSEESRAKPGLAMRMLKALFPPG